MHATAHTALSGPTVQKGPAVTSERSDVEHAVEDIITIIDTAALSNYAYGQVIADLLADLTGRVRATGEPMAYEPVGWLDTAALHLGYALTDTDADWWEPADD